MVKNVFKIDRTRCQRIFFGTHDEREPAKEAWYECGHLYAGLDILIKPIVEQDGRGRKAPSIVGYQPLGCMVTGTAEPAQNDDEALGFYRIVMNGTRNAAFLMGKRIVVLRLNNIAGNVWQDNRISVETSLHYNAKLKGQTEFSGYVEDYEVYMVDPKTVAIAGGKLQFKILGIDPRTYQAVETNTNNQN